MRADDCRHGQPAEVVYDGQPYWVRIKGPQLADRHGGGDPVFDNAPLIHAVGIGSGRDWYLRPWRQVRPLEEKK